jgi:excisionase family DNA binding protein
MTPYESERLLDVHQAARRLHVSPDTIRRRIDDGTLEALRIGPTGNVRIPQHRVDALLVPYKRVPRKDRD